MLSMGIFSFFHNLFNSDENEESQMRRLQKEMADFDSSLKNKKMAQNKEVISPPQVQTAPVPSQIRAARSHHQVQHADKSLSSSADKGVTKKIKPIIQTQKRPATKIWVGLDFGTSYTKVAYRVLGATNKVYALSICEHPELHPDIKFAQSSLLAFDRDCIYFGDDAEVFLKTNTHGSGIRNLKLLFAASVESSYMDKQLQSHYEKYCHSYANNLGLTKPGYLVTAFLIWIIRLIKTKLKTKFGDNITINFNICIPIDTYESKNMRNEFQRTLNIVELLEPRLKSINDISLLAHIEAEWKAASINEEPNSTLHIVPEAEAQMACYFNSIYVEDKIHAVIDFGAGTTDFSILNINKDENGERCAYWYNAVTFPRGMSQLENIIAAEATSACAQKPSYLELRKILITPSKQTEPIKKLITAWLKGLWEDAKYRVWGKAYSKNRKQNNWCKDHVKIFVCGGGCRLSGVKDIFKESWQDYSWGPYAVEYLQAPPNFDTSDIKSYHNAEFPRFAVAYGLTFPRPELLKSVLPKDCPDQTPRISIHNDSVDRYEWTFEKKNDYRGTWEAVYPNDK